MATSPPTSSTAASPCNRGRVVRGLTAQATIASIVLASAGCTTPNPAYCDEDRPCTDPAHFCDIAGELGPSNTCVAVAEADAGSDADAPQPDALQDRNLSVEVTGNGTVLSDPQGIDCPSECTLRAPVGSSITLTALAAADSRFNEWSGDCSGTDDTCAITIGATNVVGASFEIASVTSISVGSSHTCVVLDNGGVRCWGVGLFGRLGYGGTEAVGDNETPSDLGNVDVGGSVAQVAAGGEHTCALLDSGRVHCWGNASFGQLGYGNTTPIGDTETPASVGEVDVGGTVTQLAAGFLHTCALLDTGAVRCWGNNAFGQLGYGNTTTIGDTETPSTAGDVNIGGIALQIAAGFQHTCALLDTGAVRCWGSGSAGALGYGNTNDIGDNEVPADAGDVDIGGSATHIAAGGAHTCARLDTGAVRGWGISTNGQLGYGDTVTIGDNEVPSSVGIVGVGGTVLELAAGFQHTCARLDTGAVRCWGLGMSGRLGYGNTESIGDDETPLTAGPVEIGAPAAQIGAGDTHSCVRLEGGTVRCWGSGASGRLGHGNTMSIGDNETPAGAGDVPVL